MAYNTAAIALGFSPWSVGFNHFAEAQVLINACRVALLLGPSALTQAYLLTGLSLSQQVTNPALIQQA